VGLTPGWPDDPETVATAREHPVVFAGGGIVQIADYEEAIIRRLDRKPMIMGHSFGGLLTMIVTSTRNLLTYEAAAGVGHHVALSVVGTERLSESGYFRAKIAQEKPSPSPSCTRRSFLNSSRD